MQSAKTAVISLVSLNVTQKVLGCSTYIALLPYPILSWSDEKCARKWSQELLLCADFVIPRQGQGLWQWYKMVEVNGTYMNERSEPFWLKSLHIMSKLDFGMQDRYLAVRKNMTHYPLPEAQRKVKSVTLHHARQRAQHTTDWAILAHQIHMLLMDNTRTTAYLLPASLSMISSSMLDFMPRSLFCVRLHTLMLESCKPAASMLVSSVKSTLVTLQTNIVWIAKQVNSHWIMNALKPNDSVC